MMLENSLLPIDLLSILHAIPGNHLILLPDAPKFTIAGATDAYLNATYAHRELIIGRGVFEVYPDNPETPEVTGVKNVSRSLSNVLKHKKEDKMENHHYALLNRNTGQFETRVWQTVNKPVLDNNNEVRFIIHTVEDVTGEIQSRQQEEKIKGLEKAHNLLMQVPAVIGITRGDDHVLEVANESAFKLWGKEADIIGNHS